MKRVWWKVILTVSLLASVPAFAQIEDCASNRGAVRTGTDGGAPVFAAGTTTGTPITFDDFVNTTWEGTHKGSAEPGSLPSTRIEPEETTIYQIDGLELRSTITCEGQTRLELGKAGTSTNAAIIFALSPSDACMSGSTYESSTTSAIDNFLEKYSFRAGGDKDACFSSGDSEKNGRLLRVIGPGYWSTDNPPQLGINPILAIIELDDDGNPVGGGGTGGVATLPFQVAFPEEMGSDPVVMANASSQQIDFSTVATSTFNNDLHLSATSNAAETDDFHVSVSPDFIAAPGVGDSKLTISTTPNTKARQYIVTVTATSIDITTGAIQTSSSSFIVDLQCTPPFILATEQPQTVTAPNGSATSVSVHASGSGPFHYQWYRGFRGMTFSPVEGATGATMTVPVNGAESYWVRISNACGSVDSNAAMVIGH